MKRHHIIAAVLLLMPLMAGAQALKGSYFLDNSVNRHRMNPAFAPRANYLQLPGLGNLSVGAMSNLDIPTFFYPVNGELATFLHPSVTVSEFDRALANHPQLDAEASANILNFGFFTKRKSFWTFDLSVNAAIDVDLPRDLFMFLKKGAGTQGESFNVANLNAYATGYVSAALGYSRDIMEGLRVGAKVRFIAPVGYAALNLENMRINTGKDKWTIQTEGYAYAAVQGLEADVPEDEMIPEFDFDPDRFLEKKGMAGYGGSIDLGAEYRLNVGSAFDGLTLSAAVTDLGAIFYDTDAVKAYSTNGRVDWVGFQNISPDNADFEAAIDDLMSSAEGLLNLKEEAVPAKFSRSTMPRVYAGVEMPFLRRSMSVGLLYSGRFSHSYYRQELTASYNLKPLKWFALGLNYSFLNTTRTMGAILEITPKAGFNFCLGCDYVPVSFAPAPMLSEMMDIPEKYSMLPMAMRLNLHFGLSLAIGGDRYKIR
jgi:hypothetical protein